MRVRILLIPSPSSLLPCFSNSTISKHTPPSSNHNIDLINEISLYFMVYTHVMTILSFYFPILLSLSISYLLHTFKKHLHSFLRLATTFITTNNNATENYKLCIKRHHPISSTATPHANESLPSTIGFVDDICGGVDGFMSCTESLGFESIDGTQVDDQIDNIDDDDGKCNDDNKDEGEDGVAKGRGKWREVKPFPPPLSSLNMNGEPSFVLLPLRENGRLQLRKVRIKRPEILYASREDGRLRLYLVPDQCSDDEEEECECEEEEDEQELVEEEEQQPEEEIIVEEEAEEEEEEEIIYEYEKEENRVGEWKFPIGGNIKGFRRCYHVHGSHHHYLHMCRVH